MNYLASLEEGVDEDHDDKTLENESESADDDHQGFESFDNDTTTTGVFVCLFNVAWNKQSNYSSHSLDLVHFLVKYCL